MPRGELIKLLPVFSGILLALSFPPFNLGFFGWFSLIPLLTAILKADSLKKALLAAAVCGLVFFSLSLEWLRHVTFGGLVFVVFLQTFFFLLFAWGVWRARNSFGWEQVFGIAAAWTACEFLRTEIPVFGFGFNLLAYSQSEYAWIRQSANVVGAYGLGFAMAAVNVSLAQFVFSNPIVRVPAQLKKWKFLIPAAVIFCLVISHGIYYSNSALAPAGSIRIGVLQGNIPQNLKWQPEVKGKILEIYQNLTRLAAADGAELVIWPEAAFPGYLNTDPDSASLQQLAAELKAPILIGSPHGVGKDAFNSAYLLNAAGQITNRYDKQFLVPFGEYVPLKPVFGWLEPFAYSLGVSDFRAGKEATVFETGKGISFAALICFEDVFPSLARVFVKRGAQILAVITNDAWFGPSAAAHQHLQASIFRAIENGVPVVRAANTGISAFINPKGEVLGRVTGKTGGDLFVTGRKTMEVEIYRGETLFRKGGWVFPYVVLGMFLAFSVQRIADRKENKEKTKSRNK